MESNFERAFENTIMIEGGFSNHPKDKGGKTKYGVTNKTYKEAVRRGIVKKRLLGVKGISKQDSKDIYKAMYWDELNLDKVEHFRIAEEIFDTGVNCGIRKAARIVQRALQAEGEQLIRDGIIGPMTLRYINKYCKERPKAFFKLLNALQGAYYVEIVERDPEQVVFLNGWAAKRIDDWGEDE